MLMRFCGGAMAVCWAAAAAAEPAAPANDFPTAERVQYVLECMYKNGGSSVYVYKCSCVVDAIAQKYKYDEWVGVSTITRYQNLGGEGGGMFRDPPENRPIVKRYRAIEADARKVCGVPK